MTEDYVNGYVQRKDGKYTGQLTIDGIRLQGGINAVYFKSGGNNYLWLRRKKILEYDFESQSYTQRNAKPEWEAYLKKQTDGGTVAYKGEFVFLKFKYSIVGVWDKNLGIDNQRLNLFVERLPMQQQDIIKKINEQKKRG